MTITRKISKNMHVLPADGKIAALALNDIKNDNGFKIVSFNSYKEPLK